MKPGKRGRPPMKNSERRKGGGESMKPGKRGRPPMKNSERRKGIQLYFTQAQLKAIAEAAIKAGARYRTTWAEDVIVLELARLAAE
jgi:hypothetical protein